jgi:nucleotide-binding universal stress UspA family protein
MSDPSPQPLSSAKRKFLAVVDATEECRVALRFAARRAQHTDGVVSLIYIIPPADFQQWAGVERKIREEAREEAERALHEAAKTVNEIVGATPEFIIREGRPADEIRAIIKEDRSICILVLAAGTSKEGPGPLVSLIVDPSGNAYPIPVTVVPGNLTDEQVDALA